MRSRRADSMMVTVRSRALIRIVAVVAGVGAAVILALAVGDDVDAAEALAFVAPRFDLDVA